MATPPSTNNSSINLDALTSEIRHAVINRKANACPMVVRLAWHASGTFDKSDQSGGSNGATMRFKPEAGDDANLGLHIIRDMLFPVKKNNPELSYADLWTFAGCKAVEFMGGPKVPHCLGRQDAPNGSYCPPVGRLPDAAQGAQHVRDVFYRMGFNDQEIVALCGAHTLGRCHLVRSGFDGPWTRNPLRFDNSFFRNLLHLEWKPREWDGPLQYEDVLTGELMMLPTDMALKTDPEFRHYVELYANDEQRFFDDFSKAFAKLLSLGTNCDPGVPTRATSSSSPASCPADEKRRKAGLEFREAAMHGSVAVVQKKAPLCDVHEVESNSGRSALHKAAFWGHIQTVEYLVNECKLNMDGQDYNGDTPVHDAVRFSHTEVVKFLVQAGADLTVKNKEGLTPVEIATQYNKPEMAALLRSGKL